MATFSSTRSDRQTRRAAILIDYDNLHDVLSEHLDGSSSPSAYLLDALGELRRYLLDADDMQAVCLCAYGDFEALRADEPELERTLYLHGVEPRCVPRALQPNAAELHLCVEAVDLMHRAPGPHLFVLVTGDRTYLPLLQKLRRYGCRALVVTLDAPDASAPESRAYGDVFMDLLNLLDEDARDEILHGAGRRTRFRGGARPDPSAYDALSNPITHRTLEVTEEYFGQYEEIYLTPLLRKLSEVLGEEHDPKALVSKLEEAGAVRLEKRDGYPYDYTVLILHRDHPAVRQARENLYRYDRPIDDERDLPSSAQRYAEEATDGHAETQDAEREEREGEGEWEKESFKI